MNTTTKKMLRQTNLIMGGIITLFVIFVAVFASFLAPYHPVDDADLMVSEEPPSATFWFGTDNQGRDILSRVIHGSRISLAVGLICQAFNTMIGVVLGLSAGFFGKWWDDFVMGLTNVMLSIPSPIFALAVMALLGPGLLMFTQVLPNIVGPILVIATLGIAWAILLEASLSFLGLGVQPPTPSWGGMLSAAREQLFTAPWISIFPGIAIFVTVLGLNLLGDGLRDILDPHTTYQAR